MIRSYSFSRGVQQIKRYLTDTEDSEKLKTSQENCYALSIIKRECSIIECAAPSMTIFSYSDKKLHVMTKPSILCDHDATT